MKIFKRSTVLPAALFIYTTVMAVYFLPRNDELSNTEKWVTILVSYVIIALLWFVLRKKEQMIERHKREDEERKKNHPFGNQEHKS